MEGRFLYSAEIAGGPYNTLRYNGRQEPFASRARAKDFFQIDICIRNCITLRLVRCRQGFGNYFYSIQA